MAHPVATQRLPVAPRELVAGVTLFVVALLGLPAGQPLIPSVGLRIISGHERQRLLAERESLYPMLAAAGAGA
jgi:hypothetical protein